MKNIEGHTFNADLLKADSVVFDIGGKNGEFSQNMLNHNCKVICYEPDVSAYNYIKRFIQSSKFSVVNKAVCGHDGKRTFYCAGPMNGGNSLFPEADEYKRCKGNATTYDVEGISFDQVIQPFSCVELVKLDCEGAEFEIIHESSKETFKKINQISIEFHDFCFRAFTKNDVEECIEILKGTGFISGIMDRESSDYYFYR
jgi:FkbM family methyltransferase